jgi:hypothetical protein
MMLIPDQRISAIRAKAKSEGAFLLGHAGSASLSFDDSDPD